MVEFSDKESIEGQRRLNPPYIAWFIPHANMGWRRGKASMLICFLCILPLKNAENHAQDNQFLQKQSPKDRGGEAQENADDEDSYAKAGTVQGGKDNEILNTNDCMVSGRTFP